MCTHSSNEKYMNESTTYLWNNFSGNIREFLLKRVKQREDAEDVLQEVFIKIHNNLNELKDERKLIPWIYKIVRNTLTDYYRKNNKLYTELKEDQFSEANVDDREETFLHLSFCLNSFIDRLPQIYREPLVLSDIKGFKQRDIARELDMSYSGLKSRIQRGREKIRAMFIECCKITFDKEGKQVGQIPLKENCDICRGK